MNLKVRKIREKYPDPSSAASDMRYGYCVGGAFCQYRQPNNDIEFRYPNVNVLAMELRAANTKLNSRKSLWYAQAIACANDACHFDSAWRYLSDALNYNGEQP